jgi:hypothetical protein
MNFHCGRPEVVARFRRGFCWSAGTGVHLIDSRGPNAGITPPADVYLQNNTYFHSGKIGGGTTLPTGGLSDFFLNSF